MGGGDQTDCYVNLDSCQISCNLRLVSIRHLRAALRYQLHRVTSHCTCESWDAVWQLGQDWMLVGNLESHLLYIQLRFLIPGNVPVIPNQLAVWTDSQSPGVHYEHRPSASTPALLGMQ